MKSIILLVSTLIYLSGNAQDSLWKKFVVDSNMTVELPGTVGRIDTLTINHYSYRMAIVKADSAAYAVMVTTKEMGSNIYDNARYKHAMEELAHGVTESMSDNKFNGTVYDVQYDKVPGKKVISTGRFLGIRAKMISHLFIVNDYVYVIHAYYFKNDLTAKDSAELNHITSSINFTDDVMELSDGSKSQIGAFSKGKLVGLIVVFGVIVVGIVIFVRKL